ncbi:MAG: 1,4-alpha-glucan branching protein GlgB, partial [Gammaproteobacteria bacterium]|nr:1,4-alpha-glucan branching protein GlgB [Gammaproteobacteria bacterium]
MALNPTPAADTTPFIGEVDQHLISEGNHYRLYEKLGAHPTEVDGVQGVHFAVWAPNAQRVSVIGHFNRWNGDLNPMHLYPGCGVWELFIPGLESGTLYKYELINTQNHRLPLKSDPFAFQCEHPPGTASQVYDLEQYQWNDQQWMEHRHSQHQRDVAISIYEVHLGSWCKIPEESNRPLSYQELGDRLIPYVKSLGFTHIELLPISEHPFDGSWGYQPTGLFAATRRFGDPDEFRSFVDRCHQAGLGVILDWVAGHFPDDEHGLNQFDGTHLYEHEDPRQGRHQEWGTRIYNYGRQEVSNFLISNALFWLNKFHIDGLRVDAVASMLYLDYDRKDGEWIPNHFGGNENLEAVRFLRRLNEEVYLQFPDAFTVAEESTSWPMVSRPTDLGGLGFGYKWNMGWMNDTLRFIARDSIHRAFHQTEITFGLLYAFQENFMLPLSHDEVVHGKRSLVEKMPGDLWQKFANLRLYLSLMFAHPGKKLLFMGGEFGQINEWNHQQSLDWHLTEQHNPNHHLHCGVQYLVGDLNHLYRTLHQLHQLDHESDGFEWIDCNNHQQGIISFLRKDRAGSAVVVVCNFTPIVREQYQIGVPEEGLYQE